ncbi:Hydroxypyruvate isomerase [Polystyrenella longa]|uniref:Hydroxypyruvate isomerase n=1 Tax=Polystyrenella longa TaxID=2528007 RepID=A0A518CN64_9PLAN|nr:TIM barrel protein [Polystyrenella longa]QDU80665.1 Hydroxypyruvate isomerase [Polystyrenella longa]
MSSLNRRHFLKTSGLLGAAAAVGSSLPAAENESKPGQTANTKFAVNVEMWWRKLPFEDRIKAASELGFPGIEFWPWRNKNIDAVADLTKSLNLDVVQFTAWGFSPGLNDPKNHKAFVEEIKASCPIAHQLDCKMMTVVGGNDQPGMTQEEMHQNIITGLKLAAPIAEDNDIMLILEPMNIRVDHKGHCLYGSAPAIRICNEVDSSHVKINWDLYHMHITEGDLCGHLKEGMEAGQIGYLQLADHPGRNEPGTGEIHYNRVLKEAHALGYDGYVGLECNPLTDEVTAAKRVAAADIW